MRGRNPTRDIQVEGCANGALVPWLVRSNQGPTIGTPELCLKKSTTQARTPCQFVSFNTEHDHRLLLRPNRLSPASAPSRSSRWA